MTELKWQDPPPKNSGRGNDYSATIETLKANPGKWALLMTDWKTSSAPPAFRQSGCESTTRRNKDKKTYTVYVRFPVSAPKPPRADAGQARKSPVAEAVSTGTALRPPSAAPALRAPLPEPEASGGYTKFLQRQRAGAATQ